jgi:hypothetical protein
MTHQEAGGLVLLAALVMMIVVVLAARWHRPPNPNAGITYVYTETDPPVPENYFYIPPSAALSSAGSPCRAPGCPALRYSPMDEHSIQAHHRHDNLRVGPIVAAPETSQPEE